MKTNCKTAHLQSTQSQLPQSQPEPGRPRPDSFPRCRNIHSVKMKLLKLLRRWGGAGRIEPCGVCEPVDKNPPVKRRQPRNVIHRAEPRRHGFVGKLELDPVETAKARAWAQVWI